MAPVVITPPSGSTPSSGYSSADAVHPNRQDYDANIKEEIKEAQKREKKEKSDALLEEAAEKRKEEREGREKERKEKERDERRKQDEADKKKKKQETEEKRQESHRKHQINELKQGMEIPKYGLGRISSVPRQLASHKLFGKGVDFSNQLSSFNPASVGSFNKSRFASGKMRANFPKTRISQTGGYRDPLAGLNPFGGKRKAGRKPKGNMFSLGLFRR